MCPERTEQRQAAGGINKPQFFDEGGSKGAGNITSGSRKPRKFDKSGSLANHVYGTRDVNYFPISKSELRQLGERRNTGAVFLSLGTALIGVGIGLLKDIVMTDKPKSVQLPLILQLQTQAEFDWKPIVWAFIVSGIVSMSVGFYSLYAGKSLITRIENETDFG